MYTTETQIRVRYAETDRMGYSYYGNYAVYFEVARVEALRQVGIEYKALEDSGILLPVSEYAVKFFRPAHYDDLLTIRTAITQAPSARISFSYETFRGDELLNEASTVLVFVDQRTQKPVRCPLSVQHALAPYFAH